MGHNLTGDDRFTSTSGSDTQDPFSPLANVAVDAVDDPCLIRPELRGKLWQGK